VPLGFVYDVGWRALAASRDLAKLMCYSLSFDDSVDSAPFPIADIPTITNADYLSGLLSISH
jgi:hypothetical protein